MSGPCGLRSDGGGGAPHPGTHHRRRLPDRRARSCCYVPAATYHSSAACLHTCRDHARCDRAFPTWTCGDVPRLRDAPSSATTLRHGYWLRKGPGVVRRLRERGHGQGGMGWDGGGWRGVWWKRVGRQRSRRRAWAQPSVGTVQQPTAGCVQRLLACVAGRIGRGGTPRRVQHSCLRSQGPRA